MKSRLIVLVLATSTLILISFLVPFALLIKTFAAQRAIDQAYIHNQDVYSFWVTMDPSAMKNAIANLNSGNADEQTTIFLPDGGYIGAKPLPQKVLQSEAVQYARSGSRRFHEDVPGGALVLQGVGGNAGGIVIQTFVGESLLTKGVSQDWLMLGAVALGLLALCVIVANELTRSLVRPLARVAAVADQLSQGDLTARAEVDGPPEIRQVSNGLNRLAVRIGDLLAHERETLADLSHRLRTPLTALRIDAESLAADEETRYRVIADVDALTQTVNEIIAEARRPTGDSAGAISNATVVVRDRAAFWQPLAEDQERWMTVDIPAASLLVRVPPEDLAACVDILLENVFAHTPEGSPFSVRLSARAGGGAWLVVSDSGPGFSNPDVTKRGESTRGSTGLGLDIARRVAETSGGTLTLGRSPHGGGAVTVGFGPVQQQSRPRRHVRHRRGGGGGQPPRPPRTLRARQPARALHRALPDPLRSLLPGRPPGPARPAAEVPQWRAVTGRDRQDRYQADTDHMMALDTRAERLPPNGRAGWDQQPAPDNRSAGHQGEGGWVGWDGQHDAASQQAPVAQPAWPSPRGREVPRSWDDRGASNGWDGLDNRGDRYQ